MNRNRINKNKLRKGNINMSDKNSKKIKIKCPNCGGTGIVAVGECCAVCFGAGTIKAEKA